MNAGYLYVATTILLTVYGQLVIKWRVDGLGDVPQDSWEKLRFGLRLILSPWILSVFAGAVIAALAWMAAMTRFELGHVYPFMALSFVLVLLASAALFDEPLTRPKLIGVLLIFCGLAIGSQP